jgi:hypothetical protein
LDGPEKRRIDRRRGTDAVLRREATDEAQAVTQGRGDEIVSGYCIQQYLDATCFSRGVS